MKSKRQIWYFLIILILLAIPLIAMQFTDEVNWQVGDFVVAAVLLSGTAGGIELVIRMVKNRNYQTLFIVLFILFFLMIWAELAVGIFN